MITVELKRAKAPALVPNLAKIPNISALFDKIPEIVFKRGELVFPESNAHPYIYLVTKGIVKLFSFHNDKEMLEDYYPKDELVNCELLLDSTRVDMGAEAIAQPTIVKKIPVSIFRQAMMTNPILCEGVLTHLNASLDRTRERLRRILLLDSQQRIIDFLVSYVTKSGRQVGYEWVIQPVLTHKEMSFIAGTGRQTVTTLLNQLRKDGVIHFTRSYLIIRDMNTLRRLSGME